MKTKYIFLLVLSVLFPAACNKPDGISSINSAVQQVVSVSLGSEPTILDAAKASDRYSFFVLDYINENFGEFLNDIFIKYEDFKELEEEYIKVATSLDKKIISDFLELYDSTGSITDEDDLILDEYIKIKKVLLNK